MADYLGARHVVAFANGTAALHGAAFAAGLGAGDEVITTPISFAASANCVLYLGAVRGSSTSHPATWNLDTAAAAAAAVSAATRAVIAVSFAGLPVDLEPLGCAPGTRRRHRGCGPRARRATRRADGRRPGRRRHDHVLASSGEGDDDRRGRARGDRGRRARRSPAAVPHARDRPRTASPARRRTAAGTTRCRRSASTTGSRTSSARSA